MTLITKISKPIWIGLLIGIILISVIIGLSLFINPTTQTITGKIWHIETQIYTYQPVIYKEKGTQYPDNAYDIHLWSESSCTTKTDSEGHIKQKCSSQPYIMYIVDEFQYTESVFSTGNAVDDVKYPDVIYQECDNDIHYGCQKLQHQYGYEFYVIYNEHIVYCSVDETTYNRIIAEQTQVKMLRFGEQLRCINVEVLE